MPGAYKEIFDVSITAQFKLINNEKSKGIFIRSYSKDDLINKGQGAIILK